MHTVNCPPKGFKVEGLLLACVHEHSFIQPCLYINKNDAMFCFVKQNFCKAGLQSVRDALFCYTICFVSIALIWAIWIYPRRRRTDRIRTVYCNVRYKYCTLSLHYVPNGYRSSSSEAYLEKTTTSFYLTSLLVFSHTVIHHVLQWHVLLLRNWKSHHDLHQCLNELWMAYS